ncbi:MAG: hypothetical protein ACE5HZ_02950 [Fidelibacterota bacterium]
MGFFDLFRKGKRGGTRKRLTLAELVDRLKREGYKEDEIRDQLLKSFGKERLKSFGEGTTISPEKVNEILRDLRGQDSQNQERS